jgi:adenylate cyclase class 2
MQYEVENKFRVQDVEPVAQRLARYGARFDAPIEQTDQYFAHPVRDFAETDEALRLRRIGDQNLVTYKGPKIDQATKTRQELELPLAAGRDFAPAYRQLLEALGFRAVAEVRKRRRAGHFTWHDWPVTAALDEVQGLGQFVELELQSDAESLREAQARLIELAAELGLAERERRSYLELVLASGASAH